jgi:hypothetical protein
MRLSRSGAFLVAAMLVATHAAAQSAPVSIQFQNGNVTVRTTARTPLRTVLQEWARVGRARIVNAESVTVTLEQIELVNVPEQQALAVLLREVSGYAIGEREVLSSGPSRFDRIMLLPRSISATNAPRPAGVTTAPPPPIAFVPGDPDDDPNDLPPNAVVRPLTPQQQQQQITNAAALAAARAQQQQQQQQQNSDRNISEDVVPRPAPPTNTPANPFFNGTSGRPGEIAPVPQQRGPLRPNGDPEP